MSAKAERERLNREYEALLKNARELVSSTAGLGDAAAQEVRKKLQRQLDEAEDVLRGVEGRAREALQDVETSAKGAVQGVEDYTRTNPLQSLGLAFAAGWIVSCLWGRK